MSLRERRECAKRTYREPALDNDMVLVVINIMWGATIFLILAARRDAEKMAIEATKDFRKFKQAVEGVSDLVIITDISG